MEILQFIFQSFWYFIGTIILIVIGLLAVIFVTVGNVLVKLVIGLLAVIFDRDINFE